VGSEAPCLTGTQSSIGVCGGVGGSQDFENSSLYIGCPHALEGVYNNNNNNNASLPPSYSLPLLALDTRPVRAEIGWFDPLGISWVSGETSLNHYPLDTGTIGWMPCIKCAHCILGRCVGWRADRPAGAMKPGITQVRTRDLSRSS
jgi:hypothetical protein